MNIFQAAGSAEYVKLNVLNYMVPHSGRS